MTPAGQKRKKKRRRTRFSRLTIKLTQNQKKSLDQYCRARRTTANKLVKKLLKRFTSNYMDKESVEGFVTENQLDLFDRTGEDVPPGLH
jgi:hypothetical protein